MIQPNKESPRLLPSTGVSKIKLSDRKEKEAARAKCTYGISWIADGNALYRIPLEAGMETGWARGWPREFTLRVWSSSSIVKPDEPEKERFVEV